MNNTSKKKIKRVRANGQGSIIFHKGRKKPYEVRVTNGYEIDEQSGREKRINKSLGYYELKVEAEQVLTIYKSNKINKINNQKNGCGSKYKEDITFGELYNEWAERKYNEKKSKSTILGYKASFAAVPNLHNKVFISINTDDLREALYSSGKNYPTMRKIRLLYSQLYKYAIETRLTTFDASAFIRFDNHEKIDLNPNKIDRNPFNYKEIEIILNDTSNEDFTDTLKFMLYTGVRVSEMMKLKRKDVFINENYFIVRESKTEAGRNRPVPIHPHLKPIVEKWLGKESKVETLFFGRTGKSFTDSVYRRNYWDNYFKTLDIKYHWPHDCRHTFRTYSTECGVPDRWVERILGHRFDSSMVQRYDRPFIEMLNKKISSLNFKFDVDDALLSD